MHEGIEQVKMREHGSFEVIAFVDFFERKLRQHIGADGEVAVGRVEDVPISGGGFGEEAQAEVADAADEAAFVASDGKSRKRLPLV
jgi:hypothetical protein